MILKLQKEIALSKNSLIAKSCFLSLLVHAAGKISLDLPGQAGRKADKAPAVPLQSLVVHSGLVIKALHKAGGHNLHQVLIPFVVLCQQNQVIVFILSHTDFTVKPGSRTHINLTA